MMKQNCSKNKIVVFDLDETLGYFSEFGMVWESLVSYISKNNFKRLSITFYFFSKFPVG